MRMAVSTIGRWRRRFMICMENGMVFDAGALIVAAPARFAERMFHSFAPEIAEILRACHYDSIYRVSLGYHKRGLPARLAPNDKTFPFLLMTDQPGRVPDDEHWLIQAGVRMAAGADPQGHHPSGYSALWLRRESDCAARALLARSGSACR